MKYTKEQITEMIRKSLALSEDNIQMNFWLSKVNEMNEDQLLKLANILELEIQEKNRIDEEVKKRSYEINKKYLSDLKVFRGKTFPAMLKNMETTIRAQENPDNLLNDLNNV